jgi:hypothetical protein
MVDLRLAPFLIEALFQYFAPLEFVAPPPQKSQ